VHCTVSYTRLVYEALLELSDVAYLRFGGTQGPCTFQMSEM